VGIEFDLEKQNIAALLSTNIPSKKPVQWLRRSVTDLRCLNSAIGGVVKYHTLKPSSVSKNRYNIYQVIVTYDCITSLPS